MRKKTYAVKIGNIKIGGANPVAIQSMTNTDTADVSGTFQQIKELFEAGSELVRVTVNDQDAALAVPRIKEEMLKNGIEIPLIGDFHFNGHILLTKFADCAKALDKYRINPGNVGSAESHEYNFGLMIETALKYDKPVRIGVNWGSLDKKVLARLMDENREGGLRLYEPIGSGRGPSTDKEVLIEALVASALESAQLAEKLGMSADKLVLSVKTSEVQDVVTAYTKLAERCDYALHLGLTEAGMGMKGLIASSAALAILLQNGIGDTIRISLTPEPGAKRAKEVEACKLLLQTMGLRQFQPLITSCPGCGRTSSTYFMELTKRVNDYIAARMPDWQKNYRGVENLRIAVMGCVVNGPGESAYADIGIMLPGNNEGKSALLYIDGKCAQTLSGEDIAGQFIEILERYVGEKFKRQKSKSKTVT